ncbi:MAG: peptidylprolyl isomerase [Candidatus Micrarchaeaceae archaeon]
MSFKDNDFIEIEYDAWDAGSDTLIATTSESRAKENNIYDSKAKYGKVLVVVGSNGVIKGLDREIRNMGVGEKKKFTFKPEDAFGERNEDLVKVMPLSEFKARDITPYPGMTVELDNVTAIVRSVNSGRVVVDANNPYAGKDISYEVKVVEQISSDDGKVRALGRTYDAEPSNIKLSGTALSIMYGHEVNKNANYFVGKTSLIATVFNYMDKIEKVTVEEEYTRPKDMKTETHAHDGSDESGK